MISNLLADFPRSHVPGHLPVISCKGGREDQRPGCTADIACGSPNLLEESSNRSLYDRKVLQHADQRSGPSVFGW
ncbi:hypothetical protein [Streptomyces sp. NBC_01190]|uniref:hypothetical protein n=1 Tax=Streptomyces sp. NBC_01190 TaxID=2903767 RepID=UPI003865D170|nr:hypothetical protein OG519_24560 [Streptomyces sp. NBC_01190]